MTNESPLTTHPNDFVQPNTDDAPAGTTIVQFDGVNFQDGSYLSGGAGHIAQYFRRAKGVEISVFQEPMTDRFYYVKGHSPRSGAIYSSALDAARAALGRG